MKMFCENCGTKIENGESFCGSCGEATSAVKANTSPVANGATMAGTATLLKDKNKKPFYIAIALFAVTLLSAVLKMFVFDEDIKCSVLTATNTLKDSDGSSIVRGFEQLESVALSAAVIFFVLFALALFFVIKGVLSLKKNEAGAELLFWKRCSRGEILLFVANLIVLFMLLDIKIAIGSKTYNLFSANALYYIMQIIALANIVFTKSKVLALKKANK